MVDVTPEEIQRQLRLRRQLQQRQQYPSSSGSTPSTPGSSATPSISVDQYRRGNLGDGQYAFANGGAADRSHLALGGVGAAGNSGIFGLFSGSNDPQSPYNLNILDARKQLTPEQRLFGPLGSAPGNMRGGSNLALKANVASRLYNSGGSVGERDHFADGGPDQPAQDKQAAPAPYNPPPVASGNSSTSDYINSLYGRFLGRGANSDEVNYWTQQAQGGAEQPYDGISGSQAAKDYFASQYNPQNSSDYISSVYNGYMGRAPNQDEINYWSGQLGKGQTPQQFLQTVANDSGAKNFEYSQLENLNAPSNVHWLDGMYNDYLGRNPNADEQTYWHNQLAKGQNADQIEAAINYDPGALQRQNNQLIGDAYQSAMQRDPNQDEINYWSGRMNNGMSAADMSSAIANDPGVINSNNEAFLRDEYKGLLGRDPNQDEMNYWKGQLSNGSNYDAVDKAISNDPSSQLYQASNFAPYQVAGNARPPSQARTNYQRQMASLPKFSDPAEAMAQMMWSEGEVLRNDPNGREELARIGWSARNRALAGYNEGMPSWYRNNANLNDVVAQIVNPGANGTGAYSYFNGGRQQMAERAFQNDPGLHDYYYNLAKGIMANPGDPNFVDDPTGGSVAYVNHGAMGGKKFFADTARGKKEGWYKTVNDTGGAQGHSYYGSNKWTPAALAGQNRLTIRPQPSTPVVPGQGGTSGTTGGGGGGGTISPSFSVSPMPGQQGSLGGSGGIDGIGGGSSSGSGNIPTADAGGSGGRNSGPVYLGPLQNANNGQTIISGNAAYTDGSTPYSYGPNDPIPGYEGANAGQPALVPASYDGQQDPGVFGSNSGNFGVPDYAIGAMYDLSNPNYNPMGFGAKRGGRINPKVAANASPKDDHLDYIKKRINFREGGDVPFQPSRKGYATDGAVDGNISYADDQLPSQALDKAAMERAFSLAHENTVDQLKAKAAEPSYLDYFKAPLQYATQTMVDPDVAPQRVMKSLVEAPETYRDFGKGIAQSAYSGFTAPHDVATGQLDPNSDEGIKRALDLAGLATTGSFGFTKPEGALASGVAREAGQMTKSQSQDAMRQLWESGQGNADLYKNWNHQWNVEQGPQYRQAAQAQPQPQQQAINNAVDLADNYTRLTNPAGFYSRGHEAAMTLLPETPVTWQEARSLLTNPNKGAVKEEEMAFANLHPDAYPANQKVTRQELADKFAFNFPQTTVQARGRIPMEAQKAFVKADEEHKAAEQAFRQARTDNYTAPLSAHESGRIPMSQEAYDRLLAEHESMPDNDTAIYSLRLSDNPQRHIDSYSDVMRPYAQRYSEAHQAYKEANSKLNDANRNVEPTKWKADTYNHPGGTNYTEDVLTLPYNQEAKVIHPSIEEKYRDEWARLSADHHAKADARFAAKLAQRNAENEFWEHPDRKNPIIEAIARAKHFEKEGDNELAHDLLSDNPDKYVRREFEQLPENERKSLIAYGKRVFEAADDRRKLSRTYLGPEASMFNSDALSNHIMPYQEAQAKALVASSEAELKVDALRDRMMAETRALGSQYPDYTRQLFKASSHWDQTENPIVHNRMKDRVGPNDEKILSVEETQSDIGQQGADKGFKDPKAQKRFEELKELHDKIDAERIAYTDNFRSEMAKAYEPIQLEQRKLWAPAEEEWNKSRKLRSDEERLSNAIAKAQDSVSANPAFDAHRARIEELDKKYAKDHADYMHRLEAIQHRMDEAASVRQGPIPLMPHVGTTKAWTEQAAKQLLTRALEGGHDQIFVMGGQEQARRWQNGLRSAVDNINWDTDYGLADTPSKIVYAIGKNGEKHRFYANNKGIIFDSSHSKANGKHIKDVFGKDLAKQIMSENQNSIDMNNFIMGAEGYRQFYEDHLPMALRDMMRRHVGHDPRIEAGPLRENGKEAGPHGTYIHITPEMRESYNRIKKQKGAVFPAYKTGGAVKRPRFATNGRVNGSVDFNNDNSGSQIVNLPSMAKDHESVRQALGLLTPREQGAHEFIQSKLFDPADEKQLPQYDAEGGRKMAQDIGLNLYGMTNPGAWQDAAGYMPNGRGGFNPSMRENIHKGDYFDAAMQAMGSVVPGAGGAAAKAARVARGASKAAKGADVVSDALRVADKTAETSPASQIFQPAAPRIIRPEEIDTPTIRQVLEGNGYNIPDEALFAGRLDERANQVTPTQLYGHFNNAVNKWMNASRVDRKQMNLRAEQALEPYLAKKDGSLIDLITQNEKLKKSSKELGAIFPDGSGIDTWGLSLSPAMQWGKLNICPNHASCKTGCLGKKSGGYALEGGMNDEYLWNLPRGNSMARTVAMFQDPENFATRLLGELVGTSHEASMKGATLGARLNTLSDLHPQVWSPFRQAMPDVMFYDYTKIPGLRHTDANHHLTHSSSGISTEAVHNPHANWLGPNGMRSVLDRGDNVAVAFSEKSNKPQFIHDEETGRKYRVIDGDTHDYRPYDQTPDGQQGVIIGLGKKNQGLGAKDAAKGSNGFYWNYDPKADGDTVVVPNQTKLKRARGGGTPTYGGRAKPMDAETYMDQFHNHHHYAESETPRVPKWWLQPISKKISA